MSFNAIPVNKILTKISEFTVVWRTYEVEYMQQAKTIVRIVLSDSQVV